MINKLYHYWVFLKAVEEKSISGAARSLGISQPAASTLIRHLEHELGLELLERRSRGVSVTPAGSRILDQVRKVFIEVENLESMLLPSKTLTGQVSLGASHTPGVYWLPGRLTAFRELYPQVEVNYVLAGSSELVRSVKQRRLSMAIVGEGHNFQEGVEFQAVLVAADRLSFVGVPRLLEDWKNGKLSLPLYWRENGSSTRECTKSKFGDVLELFTHRVELPSNEAIKEAVLSGLGFAVLPSWSVRRELEANVLAEVPDFQSSESRNFHAIRRRDTPLLQADLALWNFLASN